MPHGDVALLAGDVPAASRAHAEALELVRSIGDDHRTGTLLDPLALDALLAGDVPAAREPLVESAAAAQLDAMVAKALSPADDRRERAAGAAAGPWTALDEGLAVVTRGR